MQMLARWREQRKLEEQQLQDFYENITEQWYTSYNELCRALHPFEVKANIVLPFLELQSPEDFQALMFGDTGFENKREHNLTEEIHSAQKSMGMLYRILQNPFVFVNCELCGIPVLCIIPLIFEGTWLLLFFVIPLCLFWSLLWTFLLSYLDKRYVFRNYCNKRLQQMQIISSSAEILKDIIQRIEVEQLPYEDIEALKERVKHVKVECENVKI